MAYLSKGLKVFGIEYFNSEYEKINRNIIKYNIDYRTLYAGKKVAKKYGERILQHFY